MNAKASTWTRIHAGYYHRIGSDGETVLAAVVREDDGTWAYTVMPFGSVRYGWQVRGEKTMTVAQRMAEAGYKRYMAEHRALNAK